MVRLPTARTSRPPEYEKYLFLPSLASNRGRKWNNSCD
jgi:hypothetical protein